ncbi:unnamed protein product [Calypogeia fissa]
MAAGGWCILPISSLSLRPSSPAKVIACSQQRVSSFQGDFNYPQKVKISQKAGWWLNFCSASPSSHQSLHNCRGKINVKCWSHYYGVSLSQKIQLGRAATRQQQEQDEEQFRREDDIRRQLQSPSRSTDWLGNSCNATWKETSADVIAPFPTKESSMPALDCSLSSQTRLNFYQSGKLKFWIITVSTSDELLAAATLRAQLFYSYPKFSKSDSEGLEGIKARLKHEFDLQDLLKSRVKSEFERDSKMQDLNMKVKCLLAVCEESNHDELLVSSNDKRNALIWPPTLDSPAFSKKPLVAVGTLDIQDGTGSIPTVDVNSVTFQLYNEANARKKKFPKRRQVSENRPGHKLLSFSSKQKLHVDHGYIFNLCVSQTARRHGVATALMKEAVQVAQQIGLRILYVHVEVTNASALALYQKLGYVVEEEPLDVENRFQRPRRILLSYRSP